MNTHKRFARTLLCIIFLIIPGGITSSAQEKQDKQIPLVPTGLSLEVNTKEGPVGYNSIPGELYGGRYRRLSNWKSAPGALQTETFELRYVMEGDAVRVKAYAWIGKFPDRKELIGDYLLQEGIKVVVEGMAKFGYEPMELAIVRVKPAPIVLPEATTKIPSVAVVGVEIKQSNFPTYRLTLRNLSAKDITHLEINTFKGNRLSTSKWPREEMNRPLVKAGETYVVTLSASGSGQKAQDGFTPTPPQRIVVTTAIFADKSFEGDMLTAARLIAAWQGQKIQVTRALEIFRQGSDAQGGGAPANLERFKQQASSLTREAGQEMLDETFAGFPGRAPQWDEGVKAFMEGGLDDVRAELLKDIEKYSQAIERGSGSKPFTEWISDLRQKYEAWLSRL
jgi:hypothetical protein